MSSEWTTTRIGSLGRIVTGKTPPTERSEYFEGHIPFLTPTDMVDGRKTVKPIRSLTDAGLATVRNCLVHRGVAVSCIGWQMGKSVLVLEPTVTNQQIHSIVVDESRYDLQFVYYLLASMRSRIFELGATATRTPIVNKTTFSEVSVLVPELNAQKGIASFFSSLDDRITLLRETNSTLEAIAQALFKSWFVDFDPVRAKMEGRTPEGMDEATAALFPDGFETSELGDVPRGWHQSTIGQLADVIDCLHSKKPELLTVGRPYLQLNNIRDDGLLDATDLACISESDYAKWTSRIEVAGGDCVITNVGRVGAVAQIPEGFVAAMGRNMTAIRLRHEWSYPTYLIELLQSPWMRAEIDTKTDVGTILDALNVKSIPQLRCIVAPHAVMRRFEEAARPLRAAMEGNLREAHTLASLRDTLLPRLISGQLRLPEAQNDITQAIA